MSGAVHFTYDPGNAADSGFAQSLIKQLGQAQADKADTIVTIGGDGTLLHALYGAAGKKVAGLVAPTSNSRGFWTNKSITTADALADALEHGKTYPIEPLEIDIGFTDGTHVTRYAYNDAVVRATDQEVSDALRERFGLSDIEVSVQSALLNLRVAFADAVIGPQRIMGSGLIFSTPFGSTAMGRNYSGPAIDIRKKGIVLTGMGTGYPEKGFAPIFNDEEAVFQVDVQSIAKRPVVVTFDSFGIKKNHAGAPVESVKISLAKDKAVNLVLTEDPGFRAYSSLIPA